MRLSKDKRSHACDLLRDGSGNTATVYTHTERGNSVYTYRKREQCIHIQKEGKVQETECEEWEGLGVYRSSLYHSCCFF